MKEYKIESVEGVWFLKGRTLQGMKTQASRMVSAPTTHIDIYLYRTWTTSKKNAAILNTLLSEKRYGKWRDTDAVAEVPTHGGKRPGAGRKKESAEESFVLPIRFPESWRVGMGDNMTRFVKSVVKTQIEIEKGDLRQAFETWFEENDGSPVNSYFVFNEADDEYEMNGSRYETIDEVELWGVNKAYRAFKLTAKKEKRDKLMEQGMSWFMTYAKKVRDYVEGTANALHQELPHSMKENLCNIKDAHEYFMTEGWEN